MGYGAGEESEAVVREKSTERKRRKLRAQMAFGGVEAVFTGAGYGGFFYAETGYYGGEFVGR